MQRCRFCVDGSKSNIYLLKVKVYGPRKRKVRGGIHVISPSAATSEQSGLTGQERVVEEEGG